MGRWIDLEMTDDEKLDAVMPLPMDRPSYPCGLCLSFDKTAIAKLGIELPEEGDILDMRCFMEVKSVSRPSRLNPGPECFEAQIVMILSPIENENTEPEMMEAEEPPRLESRQPLMEKGPSAAKPGRRQTLYRKAPGANWDENLA